MANTTNTAAEPKTGAQEQRRGTVLDMTRQLLHERRDEKVLALVSQLLARNTELERKLSSRGFKSSEAVSSAQLLLLIDSLPASSELANADEKLRIASAIDASRFQDERTSTEPKPPPPLRRAPSARLRRVDNPISVPAAERACPKCGEERACIGHDTTETIELIPAEVIVRRDRREKLACTDCDGELVRAPPGDKVVAGGRIGTTLVAQVRIRCTAPAYPRCSAWRKLGAWNLPCPS